MKTKLTARDILGLFSIIWLGRHGNSPRLPGIANHHIHNHDRPLGPKGQEQAASVAELMSEQVFDVVFSSPLQRAKETTSIITRRSQEQMIALSAFDINPDPRHPMSVMFDAYLYAPLRDYFRHEHAKHFKIWAFKALEQLIEEARKTRKRPLQAFVGGHAVCHPAIMWALCEILIRDGVDGSKGVQARALEMNLGEAEVVELSFENGQSFERGAVFFSLIKPQLVA